MLLVITVAAALAAGPLFLPSRTALTQNRSISTLNWLPTQPAAGSCSLAHKQFQRLFDAIPHYHSARRLGAQSEELCRRLGAMLVANPV